MNELAAFVFGVVSCLIVVLIAGVLGGDDEPAQGPRIVERDRPLSADLDSSRAAMPEQVDVFEHEATRQGCIEIPAALAQDSTSEAYEPEPSEPAMPEPAMPIGLSNQSGFLPGFTIAQPAGPFLLLPTTRAGQPLVEVDRSETRVQAYDQAGRGLVFRYRHRQPRVSVALTGQIQAQPDGLGASLGLLLVKGRARYRASYGVSHAGGLGLVTGPIVSIELQQVLKSWY